MNQVRPLDFCGILNVNLHLDDLSLFYHNTGGGYVVSNGISVCSECHLKCEEYWETGVACEGFAQDDLFKLIRSSREQAIKDSDTKFGKHS